LRKHALSLLVFAVVGAALFLRDYDVLRAVPLLKEFSELPSVAADEIARIVLPCFAGMVWGSPFPCALAHTTSQVTVSHEYLPMIRNYHYGHMPIVNHGLVLLARKGDRLLTVRVLLDLARVCNNMFCFDWTIDDQSGRTNFPPYIAYLEGYLELRDNLYLLRERLRKLCDISDSHDDLQGTAWILMTCAGTVAASPLQQFRVLLAKVYCRCLWRQADKGLPQLGCGCVTHVFF
jgi:hypothetical protein